jgi:hypothetical protein
MESVAFKDTCGEEEEEEEEEEEKFVLCRVLNILRLWRNSGISTALRRERISV